MSRLPARLKSLKCDVAPAVKKAPNFKTKRQDYLEHWGRRDFDSTATMIALAKFTGHHPGRPSLDALFSKRLGLNPSQLQQTYENLRKHRELNEAIEEMIATVECDPSMWVDPSKSENFLHFLKEMQEVLVGTLIMVRDVGNSEIVLNTAERTDEDQKKVLIAALQTAWRRCKSGTNGAPADLVETALGSTPAQLVKQDLLSIMNEFRRNHTINANILQDCLVGSLRKLHYKGNCAGTAEIIVKKLTLADELMRAELLDELLAAIHNLFDGAAPKEAEARFNQAVSGALNSRVATVGPHPLLAQLSRRSVDFLAVLRELLRLHLSGEGVDDSKLAGMSASELSQAFKNMMSYGEFQVLILDLLEMLERLQPTDPQGHSDRSLREKEFLDCLVGIDNKLVATWQLLKSYCERKGIGIVPRPRPFDPNEKKRIETALKAAFNRIGDDLNRPAGEWIEEALTGKTKSVQMGELSRLRSAPGKGVAQKVKSQLASIRTELLTQRTVNRGLLQELLESSLIRAGHDSVKTTAREAIEGIIKVRRSDRRALIEPLLEAVRKDVDGEDYEEELLAAISNIKAAASAPELRPPAGFPDLWKSSTPRQAADAIHDVAQQFSERRSETVFKAVVKDRLELPNSGFTSDGARKFLNIADQLTLAGRSKLVRDAIAEFVAGRPS